LVNLVAVAAAAACVLAPQAARASFISVQGGAIVLGRTESATVVIGVDEPPGTAERPLRLAVNVGAFSEPVRIGPGKYRATYVPPPERYPQVALVAVWRETGPDARIDFLRIPLFGTTTVPVHGKPGALVTISTPFQTFGPVPIDRKGSARVPIVVPPNVREVQVVVADRGGVATRKTVALEVPHYNRLTAALVPYAVLADGKDQVRLHVFYDLDGGGRAPEKVTVRATAGAATFERTMQGRYLYGYVAPAATAAAEVKFAVTIDGDTSARARAAVRVGLPPPSRVVVKPPSQPVAAGSQASQPVSVLVMSAEGLGLPAKVDVVANGVPLGTATSKGNGVYEIPFTPPAEYPAGGVVLLRATAVDDRGRSASGAAHFQLRAAPVPSTVVARFDPPLVPMDGHTRATLSLEVRDAAGNPLDGAQLVAVPTAGEATALVARGGGRYEATYVAPSHAPSGDATLRVADAAAGYERRFPLPLRADTRRLLVGARAGWTTTFGELSGPRVGLDVWAPFRAGDVVLGAGLSVTGGKAKQTVTDAATGLTSQSTATFAPISLRLGWEALATRRLSLVLGAGGTAMSVTSSSSLVTGSTTSWGYGALGFANLGATLGPGQIFGELSYGTARVSSSSVVLDGGGLSIDIGYRVGIF
jgi:hypothetical protein